jgi:hypothetical protein
LFAAQPIYFRFVTAPVINPSTVVLVAGEPTVVDITGLYLPPTPDTGNPAASIENVVVTLTSAKPGCDMTQAPVSSFTQVATTNLQVTITPSAALNDCPFNVSVSRHGFVSNTVSFGTIGARSEVATPSTQRGIPIGDSVLSIPLLYPPSISESVDVRFQFATCSATPPLCVDPRMVGDSVLCNVTIPADAHNCVLRASIDRNNFGFGTISNVGVTIRRPTVVAATGSIRAITPTQITITGTDLPAASDVRAVTFQASGVNCVGTITCGSPVYSPPSSVSCSINAPLTLRGCNISASVSRFALASTFADLFIVIDPVYSPMNVSFLFEGDATPSQETYTNISLGFAESLQVVGGVVTVPITPSKRGVSAVYGAVSTFSTYDAVAGANLLRTDSTLRGLLLNSIFLYTRQQFSGIPDSFLFDGALPPLSPPPPVAAPVAADVPALVAPQSSSSVAGGLDAGGIAAIAVVVSIVAIVAIIIVILVATGRIGGPVPKPPPKQSKAAPMTDAPTGTAASGGAESSSASGSGDESSEGSSSDKEAPAAPASPAAPGAEPVPTNEESSASGSDSDSDEASSGEEESSAEGSDESSSE